jgi:hypothetical protein
MTHHHHPSGDAHPSPRVGWSLLRLSALERLAAMLVVCVLLWSAVWWALA